MKPVQTILGHYSNNNNNNYDNVDSLMTIEAHCSERCCSNQADQICIRSLVYPAGMAGRTSL